MRQTGAIPASESLAALREISSDPRFGPGATLLAIVAGATSVPASDELSGLAVEVRSLVDRGLAGFVIVTEPGFVYGVARMFTVIAEMVGVRAYATQDEAEGRLIIERIEGE